MAVKRTGQLSLADALVSGTGVGVLDRIAALADFGALAAVVGSVRPVVSGPGRPSWPSVVLVKALVLQALYGLSDRETETALADRLSFLADQVLPGRESSEIAFERSERQ